MPGSQTRRAAHPRMVTVCRRSTDQGAGQPCRVEMEHPTAERPRRGRAGLLGSAWVDHIGQTTGARDPGVCGGAPGMPSAAWIKSALVRPAGARQAEGRKRGAGPARSRRVSGALMNNRAIRQCHTTPSAHHIPPSGVRPDHALAALSLDGSQ
jgi:hypothetical protein